MASGPPEYPAKPLASPTKVAVSADGGRLAIADTGHDQVMVCLLDGLLLSAHTGFARPRGVRFDGEEVVVCDTGANRVVRTTGEVLADGVASPQDLAAEDRAWLVAEAGRHRIGRIRAWERQVRPAAGSGSEGLLDGPSFKAQLSEPSGLAGSEQGVFFVDAGSSALRLLDGRGHVLTLTGSGAGLDHPLGVAAAGDVVYIADTGSSLLRVWSGGTLATLPVQGLAEPGGLDVLPDGRLVVADTGHDRVVIVQPSTGAVQPIEIDESWVVSPDGPAIESGPGARLTVPFRAHLAGEELDPSRGPPVEVTVEARPPSLLAGGPVRRQFSQPVGVVDARAGRAGSGLLLVEAVARTRSGRRKALRRFRRRHRLAVSTSSCLG